ncbi:hypothetical protein [Streptomyces sp. NPDC029526]|uniref:hypothetical protein n=1 Tax=Streptomyces sp. NPDC029526 TaxID=3155728 RepID=UPI0033DAA0E0
MSRLIHAPWTPEQVDALNRFQQMGGMHPFTCGGDHTPGSPVLVAREDGWHCPQPYGEHCDYRQDWAPAFMVERGATLSAVVAPPTDHTAAEDRRQRYAAPLYEIMRHNGWDGERTERVVREMDLVLDAVLAVANVEQAELRAAVLCEADWVVEHCPDHGCVEPSTEVCHCEIADRLRRRPAAVLPEPADRAAVLQEGAEAIAAHPGPWWDTRDRDAAAELLRRMAADEQPGARHVHITIHHPDPTTANTAALCIADLVRGEYSDSHRLTITTDAPGTGAAPSRPADETPGTTPQSAEDPARIDRLRPEFAEHASVEAIDAQLRRARRQMGLWEQRVRKLTGLRQKREGQPAAGARQDGAQQ